MMESKVTVTGDAASTMQIRKEAGVEKTVLRIFSKTPPKYDPVARHYCSTPEWWPAFTRRWFEERFGDFCRLHDNDRGEAGVIAKNEADRRFTDLIKFRGYPIIAKVVYLYLKVWGR